MQWHTCVVAHTAAVSSQWSACHDWSECALPTVSIRTQLNNRVLLQADFVQTPYGESVGKADASETQIGRMLVGMNP